MNRHIPTPIRGPLDASAEAKDRWLIQLRWWAIAGMSITVAVARGVVPGLRLGPIALLIAVIAAVNLGWWAVLRRAQGRNVTAPQIALDSLLLLALLWFSGGLTNPFAVFVAFQPALAGILCGGRSTLAVGLLATLTIAVLACAEPLVLTSSPLGAPTALLVGRVAALASLVVFLGVSAFVVAERLTELREIGERNERLAMLGRLVGSISHELATPLGTIVLGSRDLAAMLPNGSEEAAELARAIAGEAERASEMIGLLRGHIRPDERAESIDLAAVCPEIATLALDRLGFRGQRVFTAPEPVPATVLRVALTHVLQNLLANAVHSTTAAHADPHHRCIIVEVTLVGGAAEVRVTDNGRGFPSTVLARLGEPFQTTKADDGGLGLGLYVSATLALRLGGSLRAENLRAGGACVVLTLDRRRDRPTSSTQLPEEPRPVST